MSLDSGPDFGIGEKKRVMLMPGDEFRLGSEKKVKFSSATDNGIDIDDTKLFMSRLPEDTINYIQLLKVVLPVQILYLK